MATCYPISDHYDGIRLHNQNPNVKGRKSLYELLKWKLSKVEKAQDGDWVQNPILNSSFPMSPEPDSIVITFINHATVLLQFEELTIITDPVFSKCVGPLPSFGVGCRRFHKVGRHLEDLPKIDIVLISHNHYDHLDLASIKLILEKHNPLFIVPLKNGDLLKEVGVEKIVELDWWESTIFGPQQEIFLTPAQHWSGRGLLDSCQCLWGGFFISYKGLKVFFAGDSGYAPHFQEIFHRFGAMDVALLPMGCYQPRWFMHEQHMGPQEAIQAHFDLHSRYSIGIHFGTFKLADDSVNQPAAELTDILKATPLLSSEFIVPQNGQMLSYRKNED